MGDRAAAKDFGPGGSAFLNRVPAPRSPATNGKQSRFDAHSIVVFESSRNTS
jgi:hypothetical protein